MEIKCFPGTICSTHRSMSYLAIIRILPLLEDGDSHRIQAQTTCREKETVEHPILNGMFYSIYYHQSSQLCRGGGVKILGAREDDDTRKKKCLQTHINAQRLWQLTHCLHRLIPDEVSAPKGGSVQELPCLTKKLSSKKHPLTKEKIVSPLESHWVG